MSELESRNEERPISGHALFELAKVGKTKEFGTAVFYAPAFEWDHFDKLMQVLTLGNEEQLKAKSEEGVAVWYRCGLALIEALFQSKRKKDLVLLASLSWESPERSPLSLRCLDAATEIGPLADVYDLAHRLHCNDAVPTMAQCGAYLILKTAEARYRDAYFITGELFMKGLGLPRDIEKAQSWLMRSAFQKITDSSIDLKLASDAFGYLENIFNDKPPSEVKEKFIAFFRNQSRVAKEASERLTALFPGGELPSLLREMEAKDCEKKSSLRWDVRKQCKNTDLEHEVLKTILGFLNAEGGVLVIGADDDGNILGIENDLLTFKDKQQNPDHYRLHIQQLLYDVVGLPTAFRNFFTIGFDSIQEKTICRIFVKKGPEPIFMNSEGFHGTGRVERGDGRSRFWSCWSVIVWFGASGIGRTTPQVPSPIL
jgi:hypothetical protein